MKISYNQLLCDLHKAYLKARRHKRRRAYQVALQQNLNANLHQLADELCSRTYKPRPSTCFIITDPKKREILAADFRDRIVHHLFFDYVYPLFLNTFISDSYSCIKDRGTHYGVRRLQHHIRSCSRNYTMPCYVLKMDIKGYFMHIDRDRLLKICLHTYERMQEHFDSASGKMWGELLDFDFVRYLTQTIISQNPLKNCKMKGKLTDWNDLPHDKSLFHSAPGSGLPIGNLTSQLFSNVYMNVFDQFVKRELKAKYYGRYVDDFYVVSEDKDWLRQIVKPIENFLWKQLSLKLNKGKTRIVNVKHGVEFLGAFIKPRRTYLSNKTTHRILPKIEARIKSSGPEKLEHCINSYLGVFRHHASFRLRRKIFMTNKLLKLGNLDRLVSKYVSCF